MAYFVAVTDSPVEDDLTVERAVLTGVRVERVHAHDRDGPAALREADAVMCMHARLDQALIGTLRRCRVIARYGTGLDNIDRAAAARANITVAGVVDYCTQEVANHTMALLLCWNRKILDYHRFVTEKRWNARPEQNGEWGCGPPANLSEQTLGLVGFGHIGRAVAARARCFGMTVLAYSRHPDRDLAAGLGVEITGPDDLLARSDYVSLHMPLTDETRRFLNAETIGMMKPGAVLINTARGGLVDEDALIAALSSGRLGGALLDVFRQAPLPVEHPLRGLDNVILTPHVAYYSADVVPRLRRLTAELVLRHLP
jgi:D-3-phosphoglycerate dehydrogenase